MYLSHFIKILDKELRSSLEIKVLNLLNLSPLSKSEIASALGKKKPSRYLNELMRKLINGKQVIYTIPDKPQSSLQKYCLTKKGRTMIEGQRDE
jgi:ATP-dependent DNA helicase RecG